MNMAHSRKPRLNLTGLFLIFVGILFVETTVGPWLILGGAAWFFLSYIFGG